MSEKLDLDTTYQAIIAAARKGDFITYGSVARANGIADYGEVFREMNPHLGKLIYRAHDEGWPLLTAIVVRDEHRDDGVLDGGTLSGFLEPARRLKVYDISDPDAFYRQQQHDTFDWAHSAPNSLDFVNAVDDGNAKNEKKGKSPNWIRNELILALDLYFRNRDNPGGVSIEESTKCSELCTILLRKENPGRAVIRRPDAIMLRLMNYRHMDPYWQERGREGMRNIGPLAMKVWSDYADSPEDLASVVEKIKMGILNDINSGDSNLDEKVLGQLEGEKREKTHLIIERRSQRSKKIKAFIKEHGCLKCEVCGTTGAGYSDAVLESIFEIHHKVPLKDASELVQTELEDLAVLCANCHRAIHALPDVMPVDAFRESGHVRLAKKS